MVLYRCSYQPLLKVDYKRCLYKCSFLLPKSVRNYSFYDSTCLISIPERQLCKALPLRKMVRSNAKKLISSMFEVTNYSFGTFNEEKKFFFNLENIFEEDSLPADRWQSLIKEQLNKRNSSQSIFDTYILSMCRKRNNFTLALSYINFLKDIGVELNFVAANHFLSLIAENIKIGGKELFEEYYSKLKNEKYLPQSIIEDIIEALTCAGLLSEANNYISLIEERALVSSMSGPYNSLFRGLSRHKGFDATLDFIWSINDKIGPLRNDVQFEQETIITFLKVLQSESSKQYSEKHLSLLFTEFQKCDQTINKESAALIRTIIPRHWKSALVKITNRKICNHCGAKLSSIPFDESEFHILKKECEDRAIAGDDIYQRTTPKEWNDFVKFLELKGPFSIVIDGLNILYLMQSDNESRKFFHSISNRYRNKQLLVIARKHFSKRLVNMLGSLNAIPNLRFFLVNDITKDDMFVLYAALHSGLGSKFITRDYLRNHKFMMGDPVSMRRFLHWQTLHQMLVHRNKGNIFIRQPYQIHRISQWSRDSQSWHIPVESEQELDYIETNSEWLCLVKRTSNPSVN